MTQHTKGPYVPYRAQRVSEKHSTSAPDWIKFEIETIERNGNRLDSRATVQTAKGSTWVDLSIEEYTGESRRAKYTSVRLEEEAARRLFEVLAAKFGATA